MRKRGFSLMELVVVLTLISIIAAIGVPQIQMWNAKNKGIQAVSEIISYFSKAKSIASYSVISDAEKISYYDGDEGESSGEFRLGFRPQTAILYKPNGFSLLQNSSSMGKNFGDDAWKEASPNVVLKKVRLPQNVVLRSVNGISTTTDAQVVIFNSNGKIQDKEGNSKNTGTGAIGGKCGNAVSPISNVVFIASLKSSVGDNSQNDAFWFRIEIDQDGRHSVCMTTTKGKDVPSEEFTDTNLAAVLEI